MPELIVKSGASIGTRFEISPQTEVGRNVRAGVLLRDASVSRRHARFQPGPKGWLLVDLGSQNGTLLNGKPVTAAVNLADGDTISIGTVLCEFRDRQALLSSMSQSIVVLRDLPHSVVEARSALSPSKTILTRARNETVEKWSRRLQLVYEVGALLGRTLDERELIESVLEKIFAVFPKADRGVVIVYESGSDELTTKATRTRTKGAAEIAMSTTVVWDAIRNRRAILSLDAMLDSRFDEALSVQVLGMRSVVCVPMLSEEDVFGVVTLHTANATHHFDSEDMDLLLAIAGQAALALANARLHRKLVLEEAMLHDLALARRVQERFLPQGRPDVPGWEFEAHYAPALDVGGDYYGFLEMPDGLVGIGIGDVSGKGVSAALFMARLGGEMRFDAAADTDPSRVLSRVNDTLAAETDDGMFVTCLLLVLDPATGIVTFANAGHMLPLVRQRDGAIRRIAGPANRPLAVMTGSSFPGGTFRVDLGETVVLYTDGITEAPREDELFGETRLFETIRGSAGGAEAVLTDVLATVTAHLRGDPPADDITLVCFGRVAEASNERLRTTNLPPVE